MRDLTMFEPRVACQKLRLLLHVLICAYCAAEPRPVSRASYWAMPSRRSACCGSGLAIQCHHFCEQKDQQQRQRQVTVNRFLNPAVTTAQHLGQSQRQQP
jgi:hypothetical protein